MTAATGADSPAHPTKPGRDPQDEGYAQLAAEHTAENEQRRRLAGGACPSWSEER